MKTRPTYLDDRHDETESQRRLGTRDALEGKGSQGPPRRRLDGWLQEGAKAVGGGYCRLHMSLRLALAIRGTVAGHRLGIGWVPPPASNASLLSTSVWHRCRFMQPPTPCSPTGARGLHAPHVSDRRGLRGTRQGSGSPSVTQRWCAARAPGHRGMRRGRTRSACLGRGGSGSARPTPFAPPPLPSQHTCAPCHAIPASASGTPAPPARSASRGSPAPAARADWTRAAPSASAASSSRPAGGGGAPEGVGVKDARLRTFAEIWGPPVALVPEARTQNTLPCPSAGGARTAGSRPPNRLLAGRRRPPTARVWTFPKENANAGVGRGLMEGPALHTSEQHLPTSGRPVWARGPLQLRGRGALRADVN